MKKKVLRAFVELANNPFQSYVLKKFTQSSISRIVVPAFAKTFKINQEEMERPLQQYGSLHEFFIRKLKTGARPIDERENHLVSPVDGTLAEMGVLKEGTSFFVKGQHYSLSEMLGSDAEAKKYEEGRYALFYLSPSDYHRIHSPHAGTIRKQWALGKKSAPVNHVGLKYGKRPLSRNYRFITEMQVGGRAMAIVKIGAMNINSIILTHQKACLKKGDEMGYFSFGSSVLLLFEKDMYHPTSTSLPVKIKIGESIGTFEEAST
ncbi:phosphatidylserine decarboxylase [Halalkalibacterium ligniniphilum]|uniref:phosphatidylserine decarboxylase n=1 Tax=Halalkalibacterium ligniniphilum TaxID=1134413 RepID=UPI00034AC450|nr:phosphatidylserine decarboxylase [Halalkalibacterium ligniniphilum]